MLITCPECKSQVSNKAVVCPHCGYPMQKTKISQRRYTKKRQKLPNGFGQISEIKNQNLRKPFRVMVTVGKTEYGKPISKLLQPEAFFKTYNEAYAALVEYNKNPYELSNSITVNEIYKKWCDYHFPNISEGRATQIKNTWVYCSSIYDMNFRDVRTYHIEECIKTARAVIRGVEKEASPNYKLEIRNIFSGIYKYAMKFEMIDKDYSAYVDVSEFSRLTELNRKSHIPYTDEEISLFWEKVNDVPYVDVILIQCYGGWRPQELGDILLKNVDLKNGTITGGMKTKAGKNRVVPIHSKIKPLVEKRYKDALDKGSKYLININNPNYSKKGDLKFTYNNYLYAYLKIIDKLQINSEHSPHDGRKHFVTQAKKYNLDEYAIKYIVGHSIQDLTERVYTDRPIEWLISEMEKIK